MPKLMKGSKEARIYMQQLRSLKKGGSNNKKGGFDEMKDNRSEREQLRLIRNDLQRIYIEHLSPREIRRIIYNSNQTLNNINAQILNHNDGMLYETIQNEILNLENEYPEPGYGEKKSNGHGLIQSRIRTSPAPPIITDVIPISENDLRLNRLLYNSRNRNRITPAEAISIRPATPPQAEVKTVGRSIKKRK